MPVPLVGLRLGLKHSMDPHARLTWARNDSGGAVLGLAVWTTLLTTSLHSVLFCSGIIGIMCFFSMLKVRNWGARYFAGLVRLVSLEVAKRIVLDGPTHKMNF